MVRLAPGADPFEWAEDLDVVTQHPSAECADAVGDGARHEKLEKHRAQAYPLVVVDDGDRRLGYLRVLGVANVAGHSEPGMAGAVRVDRHPGEVVGVVDLGEVLQLAFVERRDRTEEAAVARLGREALQTIGEGGLVVGMYRTDQGVRAVAQGDQVFGGVFRHGGEGIAVGELMGTTPGVCRTATISTGVCDWVGSMPHGDVGGVAPYRREGVSMTATKHFRVRGTGALLVVFLVATAFATASASPGLDPATTPTEAASSTFRATRHASPPGCDMNAFLEPTILRVRRGDTNAIIATSILPSFPADFSEGDTVEVVQMEVFNQGCDITGADLIVAVYSEGSGKPGSFVARKVVATGVSIANGQSMTFNPNWVYTVKPADHDVGDDLLGAGDPQGDQMAIIGIIDAGHDPGQDLFDLNQCGLGGALHNGEVDGEGCSVYIQLLNVNEPRITVKKRAFTWNGEFPKVSIQNGNVVVSGRFLKDGKSIVKPGREVHYLYQVVNIGPINDLVPTLLVSDDKCQPLTPAQDANGVLIGDDGNDGELDVGEAWFYICAQELDLPPGAPFQVVQNNATFVFRDRNGNDTDPAVDDFKINVGYACMKKVATIVGTSGDDVLTGTAGNDVIVGFGGDDLIDGGAGDDRICAGGGADEAHGGDGKDKILGQSGADDLFGDGEKDKIKGGGGNDQMEGGAGDDNLNGQKGADTADGGGGTDKCKAETKVSCEL